MHFGRRYPLVEVVMTAMSLPKTVFYGVRESLWFHKGIPMEDFSRGRILLLQFNKSSQKKKKKRFYLFCCFVFGEMRMKLSEVTTSEWESKLKVSARTVGFVYW